MLPSLLPSLLPAVLLALLAGTVRGFSGFGYAVIMVLGLTRLLPVQQAVITAILLDLICCLGLLPAALRHCHRPLLGRLALGMLISLPLGVWLLQVVPGHWMSLAVGGISLLGGILLLTRLRLPNGAPRLAIPAGMASGLAMTTASAGGPPLMIYLLNQPLPVEVQRATAIVFFALCSTASLIGISGSGLFGQQLILLAALLWLPSQLGNQAGHWLFRRFGARAFHHWVAPLLIVLALWVILHPGR